MGHFQKAAAGYLKLPASDTTIGNMKIGGSQPIAVQSMTNTLTHAIEETIEQCILILDAGAQLVRVTVPSARDVECLEKIKLGLRTRGYYQPLVADVHFNARIAEEAARVAEKVRINPGNFADARKFAILNYTDEEYSAELKRIRERFLPLLKICRENQTALRIGVNHGSLSDRILNKYGDTPLGMVESALEFLRICRDEMFHHVVVSMKASNTGIMVHATRLLVNRMEEEGIIFPLHLGVTEAGEGEDGRIKSAVGIGALLLDGIGDTIRVSLTEEPEAEIPVANYLTSLTQQWISHQHTNHFYTITGLYSYHRRMARLTGIAGGGKTPVVVGEIIGSGETPVLQLLAGAGWIYQPGDDSWLFTDQAADVVYLDHIPANLTVPDGKAVLLDFDKWLTLGEAPDRIIPICRPQDLQQLKCSHTGIKWLLMNYTHINEEVLGMIGQIEDLIIVAETEPLHGVYGQRTLVACLTQTGFNHPVIIRNSKKSPSEEDFQLTMAAESGHYFIDGRADGLWLHNPLMPIQGVNRIAFGILQACRARITKTEFISCPSCGRTYFNLMETAARIREKTGHLKGLKIGIMGCIVNGIGEMADADYGYVGAARGKVTLYKNREVIKQNISETSAVDELIALIREHGDWVEPPS